jgi:hypothetical protein
MLRSTVALTLVHPPTGSDSLPWGALPAALVTSETNLVPPQLSVPDFAVGTVIDVVPGTWVDSPALSYQWLLDDVDIPGATGTSYIATERDIDGLISVLEIPDGDRSRAVRSDAIGFRGAPS